MSSVVTLPWGGGELDSFDPLDGGCVEVTTAGTFDSARSRCSIFVAQFSSGATSPAWAAASTFWYHGVIYLPNALGTYICLAFGAAGAPVLYVKHTGAGNLDLYTSVAGVMTLAGSCAVPTSTLLTLDIQMVTNTATGSVTLYSSGTARIAKTGLNHSAIAGVTQVQLGSDVAGANHSQIIVDIVSHIGDVLCTDPPTGNGANAAFVGDYTDVDEITYSDADKIVSTAANDIETYTGSGAYTGIVKAVIVNARANCGATGPQNLQLALRGGSTNYFSSSIALAAGMQATGATWTTDPATSSAWVTATAQSDQFGVKAIA